MKKWMVILLTLLVVAGCQPGSGEPPREPSIVPFPTVTPGQELIGILSTQDRSGNSGAANPATIAAQARQATPTPDISLCPAENDEAELPTELPDTNRSLVEAVLSFLSDGGTVARLRQRFVRWDLLGEDGFLWSDVDLTGEGIPEIITSYTSPENEGTLLILGCQQGRYVQHFLTTSDESAPPEMLTFGDMNQNRLTDLVFMTRLCEESLGECGNNTHIVGWEPSETRMVSLLGTQIISQNTPDIIDMDDDAVNEIVVRFRDDGNETTGPLRTGVAIYDWNGTLYLLSLWQPDPVQYRIHIVHEADRYFDQQNYAQAALLFNQAANDEDLDDWWSDEQPLLAGYSLYRYLLAGAALAQPVEQLAPIRQQLNELLQPNVYTQIGNVFWDSYTSTGGITLPGDLGLSGDGTTPDAAGTPAPTSAPTLYDIGAACDQVNALLETLPEAIDLLNRYGNRSPTYSLSDFCPF